MTQEVHLVIPMPDDWPNKPDELAKLLDEKAKEGWDLFKVIEGQLLVFRLKQRAHQALGYTGVNDDDDA